MLFVSEGLYRVERGGFPGGVPSEEDADGGADKERDGDGSAIEHEGQLLDERRRNGIDSEAEKYAEEAAGEREDDALAGCVR